MKTTSILGLLVCAGVASSPTAPAQTPPQQGPALRADSSGHLITPLDLASPKITGVLPPARLGTGTPSSATVLRGDGTWAGTTSTGNTVAASGNLFMGDGTGNAVAVADSADLQRVLQMRADSARASTTLPASQVSNATLVIRHSTLNADGTITIPAHDYFGFAWNNDATVQPRYCYAVATTDQPVGVSGGTTGFYIESAYYQYQSSNMGGVSSTPVPGVSKFVFTNTVGNNRWEIYVTNATSAPLTIYFPVVTTVDVGVLPVPSGVDTATVPPQPVADFDFTKFAGSDRSGRYLAERQTTVAADSVTGSAGNAGTLYAPKLSLQQTLTNGSVFGLYRGSVFRDSLPLGTLGNTHGVVAQEVALGSEKALPTVSALDPVTAFTNNGDGTYSCLWTPTDSTIANDGYQNVYVVEIDTTAEIDTPIAARHRLIDLASQSAVAAAAGTVWVQPPGTGAGQSGSTTQWKATLRPTAVATGSAGPPVGGYPDPGNGLYRYEVVSRYSPANWGAPNDLGDGAMSGLELVGGSHGYGSIGSPQSFVGDRLAVLHCTTHNAVLGGGSLQRSVFYELGAPVSIMLAWYTANPAGLRWDTRHCLFYANVGDRAANCLISHSSGSNYDRGDISDTAFIGARWSNGALQGIAMDYVNVAAGTINRVYVRAINDIFGLNMPLKIETKNSVFRQVNRARVVGNFHDNIVLSESGSDPANLNNRAPVACFLQQDGASASHNILWARGFSTSVVGDDQANGISLYSGVTTVSVQRNILIISPDAGVTAPQTYANFPSGAPAGIAFDYNLVINLAKGGLNTNGGLGNTYGWASYQAQYPTLDQHSLYVDVSADPRGIQAIFVDPLNGDFRWAQTDIARRCAAYCAANHVGPATVTSHWPVVPTVDEAVRLLTDL